MPNLLDLIVVVFMVTSAVSLLAVCLMFLVRKPVVRKVCFYIAVAMGVYVASIGVRIGMTLLSAQAVVGLVAGAMSIAALVIERMSKDDERKFLAARVLATAALVVGAVNAFM